VCTVDGKLIHVKWNTAEIATGDAPVLGYIVQTRERRGRFISYSCSTVVFIRSDKGIPW